MDTLPGQSAVLPVPEHGRALAKSLTGIRGLDEITRGGLPTGRPTLVCGGPGSGKTLLALTFLVNGVVQFDEPGVLMTFEENAEEIASDVASLGFDLPDADRGGEARRRLRARGTRRDRGNGRVRPRRPVRPPWLRDPIGGRQARRARHHRVALCRSCERVHPARGAATAVPVAEGQGRHRGDHGRARRRPADQTGARGVRVGCRDPARPPRPRSGLDAPAARGQVPRIPPRHERVSVPHRHLRHQRAARVLDGPGARRTAGPYLRRHPTPRQHARREGVLPGQHRARDRRGRNREDEPGGALSRCGVPPGRALPLLPVRGVTAAASAEHALDRHRPRALGRRPDCCSSTPTGRRATASRPISRRCIRSWPTSSRRSPSSTR